MNKEITYGITYEFVQEYLPNSRCKNSRYRNMVTCADISVKRVTPEEFPVAFIIHDYKSRDNDFKLVADEIRTYNGKLYKEWRIESGKGTGDLYTSDDLRERIKFIGRIGIRHANDYHSEKDRYEAGRSIVKGDNRDCVISDMQEEASNYLFDTHGKIWCECGEPVYHILTFGLGHNHGGTGFFIDHFYNPNCSAENYFRADQYEEARKYFNDVAAGRGDTKSVNTYKEDYIEVLMPEMVKRNPAADHKDGGDPFIEALESITSNSSSATEAGLLTMAYTAASISG